jgi:hypothetical protein
MPRINIEDGVMEVSGYEGVRTKIEFITLFNLSVGLIFVGLDIFMLTQNGELMKNGILMKIGFLMIVGSILGFYFSRSVKVQILQGGAWNTLSKYTYAESKKVKVQLLAHLGKE